MTDNQVVLDGQSAITPSMINDLIAEHISDASNETFETNKAALYRILDRSYNRFALGEDPRVVMHDMIDAVSNLQKTLTLAEWQALLEPGRAHKVMDYLLQDAFTRWSIEKPRGYSGDATLIDFIYYHPTIAKHVANASDVGNLINEYITQTAPGIACRERKEVLANIIDQTAAARDEEIDIMTIACGHLREAAISKAFYNERINRWLALDQDILCVDGLKDNYHDSVIEPREGSVKTVLQKGHKFGSFDLVYATGLYDYLIDKVAVKLTKKCLGNLKPGGKFVFAQYASDLNESVYMEMFMNWALILRDISDVERIMQESIEGEEGTFECRAYAGIHGIVIYAEITRIS